MFLFVTIKSQIGQWRGEVSQLGSTAEAQRPGKKDQEAAQTPRPEEGPGSIPHVAGASVLGFALRVGREPSWAIDLLPEVWDI